MNQEIDVIEKELQNAERRVRRRSKTRKQSDKNKAKTAVNQGGYGVRYRWMDQGINPPRRHEKNLEDNDNKKSTENYA
jgi:hypothetical protein